MSDLKKLRSKLSEIDLKIIDLIHQRQSLSQDIGALKSTKGKPTRDYKREKEVIELEDEFKFASFTFFQANQLVQIIRDFVYIPEGIFVNNSLLGNAITGIIIALIVASVIFGGIQRIAKVASRLVPIMVGLYLFAALTILILINSVMINKINEK